MVGGGGEYGRRRQSLVGGIECVVRGMVGEYGGRGVDKVGEDGRRVWWEGMVGGYGRRVWWEGMESLISSQIKSINKHTAKEIEVVAQESKIKESTISLNCKENNWN